MSTATPETKLRNTALTLSADDLWFLFNQLSATMVLGLRDPTQGHLTEEIDQLWDRACQRLIKRDLVLMNSDSKLSIESSLAEFLKPILNPKHTVFILCQTHASGQTTRSYSYGQQCIIELYEYKPGHYQLREVFDRIVIKNILLNELPEKPLPANDKDEIFFLSCTTVTETRELLKKGKVDEARRILQRAGLSETGTSHIIPILQFPEINLSVVTFFHRNKPSHTNTKGLTVLANNGDIWLLELLDNKDNLSKICRISKTGLERRLDLLLP